LTQDEDRREAEVKRPEGFEILEEVPPPGLLRRFFTIARHMSGLVLGGATAYVRETRQEPERKRGLRLLVLRVVTGLSRPLLNRKLVAQPFPVQFRRRLEMLGPTYIKLGQILSLREDVLPPEITTELKNLLDRLPIVPFERFSELVEAGLGRPVEEMFRWIDRRPLGSASIAQAHRATTREGDAVIIKLVKPGIRETLRRDAILLRMFGRFLQISLARYQPKRVADEFVAYTLREADLQREADNAEIFQANFEDMPGIVFPKIYRRYSAGTVLCMEYIRGIKPTDPRVRQLSESERDRLIDLGASAIIRMLYKDGFFHADLHPANLLILEGPRAAFIDLGMVGRFDDRLRRILLYYFYCLVMGDSDNAARYLTAIAEPGPGANPTGFRREVEEISRRWARHSKFEDFSIAQLILQSVGKAGQFRMYFPMEMVLMVKALVTYEGVGHLLKSGFDVAAVSKQHINRIFISQFSPLRIAREGLRGAPELVEALVKAPMLVTEGLRYLEQTTQAPAENPLSGVRGTLFAGFCLVAATILISFGGPWPLWASLLLLSLLLILRRAR
jgi:ubiquinone biosynthesis protein